MPAPERAVPFVATSWLPCAKLRSDGSVVDASASFAAQLGVSSLAPGTSLLSVVPPLSRCWETVVRDGRAELILHGDGVDTPTHLKLYVGRSAEDCEGTFDAVVVDVSDVIFSDATLQAQAALHRQLTRRLSQPLEATIAAMSNAVEAHDAEAIRALATQTLDALRDAWSYATTIGYPDRADTGVAGIDELVANVAIVAGLQTGAGHPRISVVVDQDVPRSIIADSQMIQRLLRDWCGVAASDPAVEHLVIHISATVQADGRSESSRADLAMIRWAVDAFGVGLICPRELELELLSHRVTLARRGGSLGLSATTVEQSGQTGLVTRWFTLAAPVVERARQGTVMHPHTVIVSGEDDPTARAISACAARLGWQVPIVSLDDEWLRTTSIVLCADRLAPRVTARLARQRRGTSVRVVPWRDRGLEATRESALLIPVVPSELEPLLRDTDPASTAAPPPKPPPAPYEAYEPTGEIIEELTAASSQPELEEEEVDQVPTRVLVVDDNAMNLKMTSRLLAKLGIECEMTDSGARAVSMSRHERFALILMDCHMPGMDGFSASRAIRALERSDRVHGRAVNRVPIIALTAADSDDDRDRCIRAGMDDVLHKPIKTGALEKALEQWLPARRQVAKVAAHGG